VPQTRKVTFLQGKKKTKNLEHKSIFEAHGEKLQRGGRKGGKGAGELISTALTITEKKNGKLPTPGQGERIFICRGGEKKNVNLPGNALITGGNVNEEREGGKKWQTTLFTIEQKKGPPWGPGGRGSTREGEGGPKNGQILQIPLKKKRSDVNEHREERTPLKPQMGLKNMAKGLDESNKKQRFSPVKNLTVKTIGKSSKGGDTLAKGRNSSPIGKNGQFKRPQGKKSAFFGGGRPLNFPKLLARNKALRGEERKRKGEKKTLELKKVTSER